VLTKNNVKISFFGGLDFGRVGEPIITNDGILQIASPYDIFGTKLKTLMQRVEFKDYFDILTLLINDFELSKGLSAAKSLFKDMFPVIDCLKAMVFFEGGNLNLLTDKNKKILVHYASKVDLKHLPGMPLVSTRLSSIP
jgi:hypothetical protein